MEDLRVSTSPVVSQDQVAEAATATEAVTTTKEPITEVAEAAITVPTRLRNRVFIGHVQN